jgi:hypothetical protein
MREFINPPTVLNLLDRGLARGIISALVAVGVGAGKFAPVSPEGPVLAVSAKAIEKEKNEQMSNNATIDTKIFFVCLVIILSTY